MTVYSSCADQNQGRIQGEGGGGVWGLQPPLLSKFLFFACSFRGFGGLQPPLLSKNLVFHTHADSIPPPPPLVESAESGQHPPPPPPPLVESAESGQPPPPPPLVFLLINNPPLSEILYPPLRTKTILFRTKKSKLLPVGYRFVGESSRHQYWSRWMKKKAPIKKADQQL